MDHVAIHTGLNRPCDNGQAGAVFPPGNTAEAGASLPFEELADMLHSLHFDPSPLTHSHGDHGFSADMLHSIHFDPPPSSHRHDDHSLALRGFDRHGPHATSIQHEQAPLSLPAPASAVATFRKTTLPRLQALFPHWTVKIGSELTVSDLARYHTQWLTYIVTNNLSGLDHNTFTLEMIHQYLKAPMMRLVEGEALVPIGYGSLLGMPSSQPLAETFFRAAVEVGDRAVESLLQCSSFDIRLNDQVIAADYKDYTAVERAAFLQHRQLTLLLVAYGADVNKSCIHFSDWQRKINGIVISSTPCLPDSFISTAGAASYALLGAAPSSTVVYRLLGDLLSRSATVDVVALDHAVRSGDCAMLEVLLHGGLQRNLYRWTNTRFLHAAFATVNPASLVTIANQLHSYDFDFTERSYDCAPGFRPYYLTPDHPPRLIDIMSLRGECTLVELLHDYGSPITPDTVVAAVTSGNDDLVRFLLQAEASADDFSSHFYTTPLAEALRRGNATFLSTTGRFASVSKLDTRSKVALLVAAAEIGNVEVISQILVTQEPCNSESMGYALSKAAAANRTASAIMLLEAGAERFAPQSMTVLNRGGHDIFGFPRCDKSDERPSQLRQTNPLRSAMLYRNKPLIRKILEHNFHTSHSLEPAVDWGDHSILKDVLRSRRPTSESEPGTIADEEDALIIAVRSQDPALLEQLLLGGVHPSHLDLARRSPAGEAIKLNKLDSLKTVLACSDHDLSEVFACAVENGKFEVLEWLVQQVKRASSWETGRHIGKALSLAIMLDRKDVARRLISMGASYYSYDACAPSNLFSPFRAVHPLAQAIQKYNRQDLEIAEAILRASHGSLDQCMSPGTVVEDEAALTAMLLAVKTGYVEMIQLILDHGADINLPASCGIRHTPLQQAVENGSFHVVKFLLEKGAQVNGKPNQRGGRTAFQYAAENGFIGIAQLLLTHGAEFQAPGAPIEGRSAIEAAAEHGRFDMVHFLLKLGSWPRPQLGEAACYARDNGHNAVATSIQTALADTVNGARPNLVEIEHALAVSTAQVEEIFNEDLNLSNLETFEQALGIEANRDANLDRPDTVEGDAFLLDYQLIVPLENGEQDMFPPGPRNPNAGFVDEAVLQIGVLRADEILPRAELGSAQEDAVMHEPAMRDTIIDEIVDEGLPLPTNATGRAVIARHRYMCHACNRPFSNSSALQRHQRTQYSNGENKMRFECSLCDQRTARPFSNSSALQRHQRTQHSNDENKMRFECRFCDQKTARKDTMKRHEATHDKNGYLACRMCGRRFRSDYFKVHLGICSG